MSERKLGRLAGLELSAMTTVLWGSLGLFALLAVVGVAALELSPATALIGALLGVALHWLSETAHQLGHAIAARGIGYPMTGVRYGFAGLLSASLYPVDEPELPGHVHIRRALGGPLLSVLLALPLALLWIALRHTSPLSYWLLLFSCLENLLVFGLGSLLPLGFNDGSTLLRWWGR